MKKYNSISFLNKEIKLIPTIILAGIVLFFIFKLGKDCANYDKRHTEITNVFK